MVGKPVYKADAANGHLAPASVARTIVEPLRKRYGDQFGGLMGWYGSPLLEQGNGKVVGLEAISFQMQQCCALACREFSLLRRFLGKLDLLN